MPGMNPQGADDGGTSDRNSAAISVQDATMRYPVPKRYREYITRPFRPRRRVVALDHINLEIREGECLGLLGPNGAGKTTLLKLIGGLLYPTSGAVLIDGFDTAKKSSYARGKVGFVINEERSFYWRLTGIQNLEFFGVLDNLSGDALKKRIDSLLELVGLDSAGDKRVSDYSSGMKQRLAIARGLMADPDILLLDEPTKSLDPSGAVDLRRLITSEVQSLRRRTLVVATNNVSDIANLCDQLAIVNHSRIVGSRTLVEQSESEIESLYHETVGQIE